MPRRLLADPRAKLGEPRLDALVGLTVAVTEAPWRITRGELECWRAAGLSDDDVVHALTLAAFFGHLNRVADAVAVPLDYQVRHQPPPADPLTAPWPTAPASRGAPSSLGPLELARRPATASALSAWRTYVMDREAPLPRRPRELVAAHVASWLGAAAPPPPPQDELETALCALARQVTLAPWQLGAPSFTRLRDLGLHDEELFDTCVAASTAGMLARLSVALQALAADQP